MTMPREITLTRARDALVIRWDDGATDRLPAARLRAASRSAGSVRAAIDGAAAEVPGDLAIVDVRTVGVYALNLVFSDGHDRGIYPWALLRRLAGEETAAAGN